MKNDMTDVKISVIVPCHNVVGMVGECLESMMKNMFISEFTRMIFTLEMKHFMFRLIRHQNQEAQHATV